MKRCSGISRSPFRALVLSIGPALLLAVAGAPLLGQQGSSAVWFEAESDSSVSEDAGDGEELESVRNSFVFRVDTGGNEGVLHSVVERHGADFVVLESTEGDPLTLPRGERGYLGVHVVALSSELCVHLGATSGQGLLVSRVVSSSPAERAGVAVGDLLLAVDGEPVASDWDLKRWIAPKRSGEPVRLTIVREGTQWVLESVLESRRSRTLDLAPLIHSDQQGRMVLVAPMRSPQSSGTVVLRERAPTSDDETTVHLEQAFGGVAEALRDERLNEIMGIELEERRALEERIRFLEERLREIERKLQEKQ